MNELETLLSSGQITAYCLGNLDPADAVKIKALADRHPEIREAVELELNLLEKYAQGPKPRYELKQQVLDFLDRHWSEAPIDLSNPPLLHPHSDRNAWNTALQNLVPETEAPGYALKILKDSPDHVLSLVWLSGAMLEDKHDADDFHECFFILEGECECDFEGRIARFSAGDYFEIPPDTTHSIKNISRNSGYVKGLVQRKKAA